MKKVEAIIRPEKLALVQAALEDLGYGGMTITDVRGHGVQKGVTHQWRGRQYAVTFLPKVKIEVVVGDDQYAEVLKVIEAEARTGEVGDGKVFVSTIDEVMRVRTGERGEGALGAVRKAATP